MKFSQLLNMINSPINSYNSLLFSLCCLLFYYFLQKYFKMHSYNEKLEVTEWIVENNFEMYKYVFENKELEKLVDFANIENIPELTASEEDRVKRAANSLKQKLIFHRWLDSLGISQYFQRLTKEEVNSLEDVYSLDDGKAHEILGKNFGTWSRGRQMLPNTKEALESLKLDLWMEFAASSESFSTMKMMWFNGSILIISICAAGITTLIFQNQLWFAMQSETSILHVITGRYLDPNMCCTYFSWTDPHPVGETLTFIIKFFQRNGLPYPICDKDNVLVEINFGVRKISSVLSLGGTAPEDANQGTVKFTVRYAGEYQISVFIKNVHIRNSPFTKKFLPGPVDPSKTKFERHSSIVICCVDVSCSLTIQPRDSFQNLCLSSTNETNNAVNLDLYRSVVKQGGEERTDVCFQSFTWDKLSSKISFDMIFLQEGCYQVQVYYSDFLLQNGDFTCVVLNRTDHEMTTRSIKHRSISYEGKLIRVEGEPPFKPKRVIMYISPKQFTIKEFMLKFLMKRVATFRLCPSTKLQLLEETANGVPSFCVEDGCQPTIYLAASNRNLVAATFTKFLLNNIGGSETFTEKQYFFYYEVRKYHQKHKHEPITIRVNRNDLLQSSLKATKNFTVKEWCNNFEVIFQGEQGIDWGGLRREWFQLTCETLFNPNNNLFKAFSNNPQALVHPNKHRPANLKLKYYEFAGRLLGKCLYESALGGSYSQFVTAKFTRSFLAQLIGLRINHSYFQFDDPDLFLNKVKYILEHDVSDMDLYFVDEEYDRSGQLVKVVDLIPNGNRTRVTNNLKRQYLDSLAQYRLATNVKDEIETFLKGLNDIIPDNLLCIFDENELELLLCGTGEYSIADFRAHHIVNGPFPPSIDFARILKWFWIAISNFTTEEMARLLQFTTGSSQLPPGGFKDLNPQFQLMPAPSFGNLPTAHTCFNQLCLPDYETYEQFEKSLLLAITEGTEGFGLI